MSGTGGSITQFFDAMRAGDAAGAQKLWERFFPRLHSLARKPLLGRPQRAADAEDAAQSAFASFFHRPCGHWQARTGSCGRPVIR